MASSDFTTWGAVKKPRACVPCHDRKVRCDASQTGLPCSRCIKNDRTSRCKLVDIPVRPSALGKRKTYFEDEETRQRGHLSTQCRSVDAPSGLEQEHLLKGPQSSTDALLQPNRCRYSRQRPTSLASERTADSEIETVLEEDIQLEICRKMVDGRTGRSASTHVGGPTHRREILEYYDGVNSTTILGELFSQNNPHRFVKVALRDSLPMAQGQTEDTETATFEFLRKRGAFQLPAQHICEQLLRLYFEIVHMYMPVLNRVVFLQEFHNGTYSLFLLQCILLTVIPHVPANLLLEMGYKDRNYAQRTLFDRVQLLYDLGAEQSQLSLLQGSLMMSYSHFAFVVDKDCRFWLINAVRLATQMGLHRKQTADQLYQPMQRLFNRLFWVLYNKDVLMAIVGRASVRRLNDHLCDARDLTEDDFEDDDGLEDFEHIVSPVTRLQKLYVMQTSKLCRICARFNDIFRAPSRNPTRSGCADLERAISEWRKQLPAELHPEVIDSWSSGTIWTLVLRATSYCLESMFYRSSRNIYSNEETGAKHQAAQKQQNAMLELSSILDRMMLHDLVSSCPVSMSTCASTVVAMHIETALSPSLSVPRRQTSQSHIHNGLAFLRAASECWDSVRGSLRLLEEIVNKMGLSLGSRDSPMVDLNSVNPFTQTQNRTLGNESLSGDKATTLSDVPNGPVPGPVSNGVDSRRIDFHSHAPSHVVDLDFLRETRRVDDDPEKWLNELLAENFLGMDNLQSWNGFIGRAPLPETEDSRAIKVAIVQRILKHGSTDARRLMWRLPELKSTGNVIVLLDPGATQSITMSYTSLYDGLAFCLGAFNESAPKSQLWALMRKFRNILKALQSRQLSISLVYATKTQGIRIKGSLDISRMSKHSSPSSKPRNAECDDDDRGTNRPVLDVDITNQVISATGPKANARLASIIPSLTKHLHAVMRECQITNRELQAAFDLLAWAGKMTDDKRHEVLLVGAVFGLDPLADDITYALAADGSTQPCALGPFWRANAPLRNMGDSIVFGIESGDRTYMHGRVLDALTGDPIESAELDIWESAPNGLYEQQDPNQIDMNLRGRFITGSDGSYNLYCLRPTTYPIPDDGPAGKLLQLLDRHCMRPAHIHCIVTAKGYKPLTTELFDSQDEHVYDDAVFGVREGLIVDFLPREGDAKAPYELEFTFKLARRPQPGSADATQQQAQ